jgi:hypothetical protein
MSNLNKLTDALIDEAKAHALRHISNHEKDSDPYDHWNSFHGLDINVYADDDENENLVWKCAVYSGQYHSDGYWTTNYNDYKSIPLT